MCLSLDYRFCSIGLYVYSYILIAKFSLLIIAFRMLAPRISDVGLYFFILIHPCWVSLFLFKINFDFVKVVT